MSRNFDPRLPDRPGQDIFAGIRCIVCGNEVRSEFRIKHEKPDCIVVQCRKCSFQFIPPTFRKNVRYDEYKSAQVAEEVARGDLWLKTQRNLLRYKLIEKYQLRGKLFDVGCGFGHFLWTGKERGYDVSGVETNKASVDFIKKYFDINVEQQSFLDVEKDGAVDTVTLWDVLEHIDRADEFVAKISSILTPGGYVYIQVPQIDSFFARLFKDRWWAMGLDHVNYFSRTTITRLFGKYGLDVVAIYSSFELKNVLLYVILPKLKRRRKAEKSWTAQERQKEFNKITGKPKVLKKTIVVLHNILYKALALLHIGDEMIVVGRK
jgi:2-polyprenyl-3-methyl-5-hydroxy-6-metoxy-1,4-benzoquinol methylase